MAQYESKDLAFEYPDGWIDRTVVAFAAPATRKKPGAASFVVTRERMQPGETLKTFSARQLSEMAKNLRDFELKENADITVAGSPGVLMEFTWTSPNAPIAQCVTAVAHDARVILLTWSSPLPDAATTRLAFMKMLETVQLRAAAPSSIAAVPGPKAGGPAPADQEPPPQGWGPGSGRRR